MPVGAILSGVGAVAGALGGGGESAQTQQGFISPQQAQFIGRRKDAFVGATGDLNRRSIEAANQAQAGLGFIQRGELDPASQSLISQNVDRNRRLQSARQASLASQFGAGSALSGILGRQGALRADLATNQQTFGAFRDQLGRQQATEQSLGNILGLRGVGVAGLGESLRSQQRTAALTAGKTTTERDDSSFLGRLGDVAGRVGAGFNQNQQAFTGSTTLRPGNKLIQFGEGNFADPRIFAGGI